jgi:hypothetical protein
MKRIKRAPKKITATLDAAVLRAFRRASTRYGYKRRGNQIIERLIVCWLRSDDSTRSYIRQAGNFLKNENAAERRERLATLARNIIAKHGDGFEASARPKIEIRGAS